MAIPIYVDEQGNYYTLQGTTPVNVGWDVVNENGGPEVAVAVPAETGKTWRGMTGIGPAEPSSAQVSAGAALRQQLDQYGLGTLADWSWQQIVAGKSPDEIIAAMRETDAYKQRFAGNEARRKAGLPTLSEANYIAYENQARQMMRAAGLPAGFYDSPDDFKDYLAKDISVAELSQRVAWARDMVQNDTTVSAEERAQLIRLYGAGGTAAYYLDPERALPVLQKQVNAAQTAAAAQRAGFGALSAGQAERASALSGSLQQSAQLFGKLASQRELMGALPGELGVDTITADEQINAAFGNDALAQEKLSRRARKRQADMSAVSGNYQVGAGRSTQSML